MTVRRRLPATIGAAALLAAAVALSSLGAAETALPPELVAQGWEEITFDGKRPNRYAVCGEGCIEVATDVSVSMIGRPVTADLARRPVLTWEWKVETPITVSDLTAKGMDDRAVAVYVTFPYDPETATLTERLLRPLTELARGADAPARMLSYVWGGFGKVGDVIESPFFGGVNAMVICRTETDPVGPWLTERMDVVADHERAFGSKPVTAAHVLISADSDDTGGRSLAFVRGLAFQPK